MIDKTEKPISKKLLEPPCPCPSKDCTSSDGFHIYEKSFSGGRKVIDGWCYSCRTFSGDPYGELICSTGESVSDVRHTNESPIPVSGSVHTLASTPAPSTESPGKLSVEDGLSHPIRGICDRGISYSTAQYFGVRIGVSSKDGETPIYTLFPRYRDETLVGWKTKTNDKKFLSSGGPETDLFGSHLCKPQGKKLYISEGEGDCLAIFQAIKENSSYDDYNPNVVSLPDGCSSALKSLSRSALVDAYDELVLVFDNDSAGKKARDEVCKAYAGKVSYVTIPSPYKDANDMVIAGKSVELKWLVLAGARKYHPDGLVRAKDLRAELSSAEKSAMFSYPDSMPLLNEKTYGPRMGTLVTITSGSGSGKTSFIKEIMYWLLMTTQEKIAGLFLEEDKAETIKGLISLHLMKRIHLPDVKVTEEELNEAFDTLYDSDRIGLYDFFGGMDDSSLLSKLRYYALTGHKFIFLDHLSLVISEFATEGDERKRIDVLMTKLAKFVKQYDVCLFLVVHLRKGDSSNVSFEMGAVPTLDDLRGSAALKQLSWDVFALSRNQQHRNPYCADTTELTVLKCRFTGRTGTADYLHYDGDTGRMVNVEKPMDYREVRKIRSF